MSKYGHSESARRACLLLSYSGLLIGIISLLAGCDREQHLVEQRLLEFGTIIEITMISEDLNQAQRVLTEIEQRLSSYRNQWHAWEESDLTRFNLSLATSGNAKIPPSLDPLLQLSQKYHQASFGLFNPALGKLVAAYGFHGSKADQAMIAEIKRDIPTMRNLVINEQRATSNHPHLQLDLGGIAKGYALGLISNYLDSKGILNYIVNAGGDLQISGNRFGQPWRIGIQNPFAAGAIASLKISGKHSLFTSGNYQRQYQHGDKLIHHIINPVTGDPSTRHSSATILTDDPVLADVAATAMMIDGIQKHLELSKSLQIEDYLIVSASKEIIISRSLADKLELSSTWSVKIIE